MNKKAFFTGWFFIVTAIAILFYKINVLKIPILPYKDQGRYQYEIELNNNITELMASQLPDKLYLPIPPDLDGQKMIAVEIENKELGQVVETSSGKLFEVDKEKLKGEEKFKVTSTLLVTPFRSVVSKAKLDRKERKKYLDTSWLDEEELELLKTLNASIVFKDDSAQMVVDKVAYFLLDEFVIKPLISDFKEVIQLKNGDSLSQAKLFIALCRLNGIPARISFGTKIIDEESDKKIRHMRLFVNEYYQDGKWHFFHPDFPNVGTLPTNFLVVYRDVDSRLELFNSRDVYSTKVKPVRRVLYDSKDYFQSVISKQSNYSLFSLYRLPLGTQSAFLTLLLLPLGTLILSLARNIIGVVTFGVFTPILLTLFFLETSFLASLSFLISVVVVGLGLHYFLNKLYLLAVPKLSIILTVVILMYVAFALITNSDGGGRYTLNYFPIVIISVFTERFMVMLKEEGLRNTFTTLLGTIAVSSICYLIFSVDLLSLLFFNHPELILITIGLNIFIGSYTGFRVSELFRFKEILRAP